jgi:hypothetical protein
MDEFRDPPLERAQPVPEASQPDAPRPPLSRGLVIVALAGLVIGGAAAWWWTRPAPVAVAPAAAEGTEAAIPDTSGDAPPQLPPLTQMDTFLRALLGALSSHPEFVKWLATDDLIRQMARGIDRVSRGQSPASNVAVLRPAGDFAVARRRGEATIDPASFGRYDRLAAMVDSLDPRGVADAYRLIQPRLDEAYRALGRSETGVDDAMAAALQTLIDTPVPEAPIALVSGRGATFAFRDPRLEALTPAQKQLLRFGPDNQRRIQARLRAIRAELTRSESRAR